MGTQIIGEFRSNFHDCVSFAPQLQTFGGRSRMPEIGRSLVLYTSAIARLARGGCRLRVFRILVLLFLVSTLVVPRVAWDAHLSGHYNLSSADSVHSHHGDHAHEDDDGDQLSADRTLDTGDSDQDGLTHDHGPSFAISAAAVLPDAAAMPAIISMRSSKMRIECDCASISRLDTLLRPPRAV